MTELESPLDVVKRMYPFLSDEAVDKLFKDVSANLDAFGEGTNYVWYSPAILPILTTVLDIVLEEQQSQRKRIKAIITSDLCDASVSVTELSGSGMVQISLACQGTEKQLLSNLMFEKSKEAIQKAVSDWIGDSNVSGQALSIALGLEEESAS